jgi:hypothetical protein
MKKVFLTWLDHAGERYLKQQLLSQAASVVKNMDVFLKIRSMEFARSSTRYEFTAEEDPVSRLFTTKQAWGGGKLILLCYPR